MARANTFSFWDLRGDAGADEQADARHRQPEASNDVDALKRFIVDSHTAGNPAFGTS